MPPNTLTVVMTGLGSVSHRLRDAALAWVTRLPQLSLWILRFVEETTWVN